MSIKVIAQKLLSYNSKTVNNNIYSKEVVDAAINDAEFKAKLSSGLIFAAPLSAFNPTSGLVNPDAICGKLIAVSSTDDGLYGTLELFDTTDIGKIACSLANNHQLVYGCIGEGKDDGVNIVEYKIKGINISGPEIH